MAFPPDSTIPQAAVCLRDAVDVAVEARYAAHESFAHRRYYDSTRGPEDAITSVFFGKFYLDDAALRLYAAAEHLANAVVWILAIDPAALKVERRRGTSRRSVVWRFLKSNEPTHVITTAFREFGESWQATMRYRNDWVHGQPPRFEGQGIAFNRGNRWRGEAGGPRTLVLGGGDPPMWTVEKLADAVVPALRSFASVLQLVVDHYIDLLGQSGLRLTPEAAPRD